MLYPLAPHWRAWNMRGTLLCGPDAGLTAMCIREIKRVAVVGCGFMGREIGLQCAVHGRPVRMYDVSPAALRQGKSVQAQLLDEQIQAAAVPADQRQAILDRIDYTDSLADATARADLVIEVVKEELETKRKVFAALDETCPAHTILTTNSSSIRISLIESATSRPDKVANTHFVQPVWCHNYVEVMRGTATSDDTYDTVAAFMRSINVMPVRVRRESTGFIYNRIWRAVKKEALKVVDSGVASHEDVDRTWMIQMDMSRGPCAMMDIVGLDVVADIEMVYYRQSGDESDAPPKVLLDMIEKGELGVKTGKGFYTYPNPSWQSPDFLTGDLK